MTQNGTQVNVVESAKAAYANLLKSRDTVAAQLAEIDSALAAFGGAVETPHRGRPKGSKNKPAVRTRKASKGERGEIVGKIRAVLAKNPDGVTNEFIRNKTGLTPQQVATSLQQLGKRGEATRTLAEGKKRGGSWALVEKSAPAAA